MSDDQDSWLDRLRSGERRALAQLLSRAESSKPEDVEWLSVLLERAGEANGSVRVGITGIPGAGKSSLIEALGAQWIAAGKRVAVLAVDPSSPITGGSILGDKLRMPRLTFEPRAFVRPMANGGLPGGGAQGLDDCVRLCELAGYDIVVIETVGVGQNETDVASVCDVLVLVVVPGTGDEVQALKRGITEVVDLVAVNKADVDVVAAEAAAHSYHQSLSHLRHKSVPVLTCSALEGSGIIHLALQVSEHAALHANLVERGAKRQALLRRLIEQETVRECWRRLADNPTFDQLNLAVGGGQLTIREALSRVNGLLAAPLGESPLHAKRPV